MPNSLTIVLPFISVYSTHPPVSVYGTGGKLQSLEAFLDNKVLLSSGLRLLTSLTSDSILTLSSTADEHPPESTNRLDSLVVSPHRSTFRCRNINRLAIDYAFRPRLRTRLTRRRLTPTNPTQIDLTSETLDISMNMVLTCFSLLMPAFSLLSAPGLLTVSLHRR